MAGISIGEAVRRDVLGDDAAGPDDGAFPDGDAGKDGDTSANPAIVLDDDGLGIFPVGPRAVLFLIGIPFHGKKGMEGGVEGDVGTDEDIVPNRDFGAVEDGEVEIGEEVLSDRRVLSVVEVDGAQKGRGRIGLGKEESQDSFPFARHVFVGLVVLPTEDVGFCPVGDESLVRRIIGQSGKHLFFVGHIFLLCEGL